MGAERVKKRSASHIGRSRGGWTSKLHRVAASGRDALVWSLTPGQAGDAPEGRQLVEAMGHQDAPVYLLMDSAYEGNETRAVAIECNFIPVVAGNPKRKQLWPLDKLWYRRRNEVERLFRRIKAYRRVFTRYGKLDEMFTAFVSMALIYEHLR